MVLGITSLGVYGVALSGWSSNSKYSLLGGLRASAQMVSYEIALGLSLVGVLILAGTFSLRGIVDAQAGHFWGFIPNWFIFRGGQFVAFFIYLTAAYAETNRIPFDLAGSRDGTGRWISHRVQRDEVRHVLHGGIREHDHRRMPRFLAVPGGMAWAAVWAPIVQEFCRCSGSRCGFSCFSLYIYGCAERCRASVTTN